MGYWQKEPTGKIPTGKNQLRGYCQDEKRVDWHIGSQIEKAD